MEFYGMTGEKLGTIGQVEGKGQMEHVPRWKKEFLAKPSISVRKGIAWGYSPPYEDTATLVLTSPESVFVDIRFPTRPDTSSPLTSDPSFWAFSGSSTVSFDPDTAEVTMPYSAHAVWKHEIDSKGPGISDEGDMFLLANGDCIEVGMMENPRTGKIEMYKEYWTTPPTEPGSGELRRTPCVVARTQEATETTSGVIIRVGDYCQGIARHAETGVLVERWQRLAVEANPALGVGTGQESSTEWLEDWRSNTAEHNKIEGLLPCMWTCREDRKLGDEIVVHGVRWKIVEAVV